MTGRPARPGPGAGPRSAAVGGVRQREVDHCVRPHHERLVHLLAQVGREDDDAVVLLDAPEEVVDLEVGVAVVRVADLVRLPEQRVGLVEEQDRVAACAGLEDLGEVLLGLADILRHHRRQVDPEQLEAELGASKPAAIVLPVPGGPVKAPRGRLPLASLSPKPQRSYTTARYRTCS